MPITVDAPAKINLYLDILSRRADGFHNLRTLFLPLDLHDVLSLVPGRSREEGDPHIRKFQVLGPFAKDVPADESNLIAKALRNLEAQMIQQLPEFDVTLVKNIPHGAGLGGGSSDAAAAIRAANELLGLDKDQLHAAAAATGSDCAFFLLGGVAEASGRGELLTGSEGREIPALLLLPDFAVSTAAAYGALRPEHLGPRSDGDGARMWVSGMRDDVPELANSFEDALDAEHPILRTMRGDLERNGAIVARLSGSGSATFGLFASQAERHRALAALGARYRCIPCKTTK